MLRFLFRRKYRNLSIYTDGACWNNGRKNARASYALYCIDTKYKESGVAEYDNKVTNNVAELMGILQACKYARKKTKHLRIFSDSKYAIGACSAPHPPHPGRPNSNLIREIKEVMKGFSEVEFEWIKAHIKAGGTSTSTFLPREYFRNR